MSSLGFLGSVYMFFLIALLVVALGAGANYLAYGAIGVLGGRAGASSNNNKTTKSKGGYNLMENNPWLRYALYSFLGILLLMAITGLLMPNQQMYGQGQMMPGMNGGSGMNMQMPMGNAVANGGMMVPVIMVPVNMPMGQMPMQMPMGMQGGNMGMMSMPMGQMPMSMPMGQMPMQMPMGMQGGNMGMMGMPMGMQSGGMGMMGMPMGNMQSSGMSNMQGGGGMSGMNMSGGGMSGGSSGGGMGMMGGMM